MKFSFYLLRGKHIISYKKIPYTINLILKKIFFPRVPWILAWWSMSFTAVLSQLVLFSLLKKNNTKNPFHLPISFSQNSSMTIGLFWEATSHQVSPVFCRRPRSKFSCATTISVTNFLGVLLCCANWWHISST